MDQRDLHDLLDERSRPALERPIPWEALRARMRGARRRRIGAVAVAGVAATTVAVAGGLPTLREADDTAPTTAAVTDKIPAQYQESDGTVYRRIATATLDPRRGKSVTFDVEVNGKPLAVLPDCPKPMYPAWVTVRVPGVSKAFTLSPLAQLQVGCEQHRAVDVMPLPAGTRRASVTVEVPKGVPQNAGALRVGVYEWTPPATIKAASRPAEPPARLGRRSPEFTLLAKKTITWPRDREVTISVPNRGRMMAFMEYCGDDLAGRLVPEVPEGRVNGRVVVVPPFCPEVLTSGYTELGTHPRSQKTVTIRVRLIAKVPEYLRRPGTMTLAVYEKSR
ncbi:hypothetical protein ABT294_50090 [Nonomuraea sp. NPDC000554]|uniref:hypothetical protein n=1 Tax=Nonomuraea sp. NPDC000554 TaxID=3154259 RepID=UPI0033302959